MGRLGKALGHGKMPIYCIYYIIYNYIVYIYIYIYIYIYEPDTFRVYLASLIYIQYKIPS